MKTLAEELHEEELALSRRMLHLRAKAEGPMSMERAADYCEQMDKLMPKKD